MKLIGNSLMVLALLSTSGFAFAADSVKPEGTKSESPVIQADKAEVKEAREDLKKDSTKVRKDMKKLRAEKKKLNEDAKK